MGWILCNDSENKDENADYGEMTRKEPKEFIGNDQKSFLKDDLGTKRLKIINEIEVMKKELMKKELMKKELDAQIALESTPSSEKTSLVLNKPASKSTKPAPKSKKYIGKIEELPTEILEHILKQIFDLKSITKCFNINLRWRRIVEEMFKNTGKFGCLFVCLCF